MPFVAGTGVIKTGLLISSNPVFHSIHSVRSLVSAIGCRFGGIEKVWMLYSNEKTILISELTPCSPVGTADPSAIENASSSKAKLF